MSASATMPYFIKPSVNFTELEKHEAYDQVIKGTLSQIDENTSDIAKMSTINCMLKTHLPYAYWAGFYIIRGDRLEVGPYQGTLGCLWISIGQGVCGKAAYLRETQIVDDCHALTQGIDHIACDPNSRSEIVVPVCDATGELIAVLDIDSSELSSFDQIDQMYLERLCNKVFKSCSTMTHEE